MKGILMTPDNIRAIREKRKTQTRRLHRLKEINQCPDSWLLPPVYDYSYKAWAFFASNSKTALVKSLYQVRETVYLKEAYCIECTKVGETPCYRLDCLECNLLTGDNRKIGCKECNWRSPLFLPEWAARDFITITDVKPERLQDITSWDCIYEGISQKYNSGRYFELYGMATDKPNHILIEEFRKLWDSINGKVYPWKGDWWIWKYTFLLKDREVENGS